MLYRKTIINMAIDIKPIPVLSDAAAAEFEKIIEQNCSNRDTIDFSEEIEITQRILEKADQ